MKTTAQQREDARCLYLHRLLQQIDLWMIAGATVNQAIGRARRKRRRSMFKNGRLSQSGLINLYYRWRKSPGPESVRRHYAPGPARIPLALVDEFLNRLTSDRVVTASAVMQSLRSDWKLGRSIPGLGTWREYWRRLHGENAQRAVPPAFPASARTFYTYLGSTRADSYQQRINSALRAQRELNRFLGFIETRRAVIAAQRCHEPLG
jgi:hypothetical protein